MASASIPGPGHRDVQGAATRGGLVLGVILVGSLPPGLLAAGGRLGRDLEPLRWVALFAPATVAAGLLLVTAYFAARGAPRRAVRLPAGAGGIAFLLWCAVLAAPLLLPGLSAGRWLPAGAGELDALRQRAMLHPEPRRRLQAAWSYYLQTGEAVPFLDGGGRPVLFQPGDAHGQGPGAPRRLAHRHRPGALEGERRALALGTASLIVILLASLPLAAALGRRHGARRDGPCDRPSDARFEVD